MQQTTARQQYDLACVIVFIKLDSVWLFPLLSKSPFFCYFHPSTDGMRFMTLHVCTRICIWTDRGFHRSEELVRCLPAHTHACRSTVYQGCYAACVALLEHYYRFLCVLPLIFPSVWDTRCPRVCMLHGSDAESGRWISRGWWREGSVKEVGRHIKSSLHHTCSGEGWASGLSGCSFQHWWCSDTDMTLHPVPTSFLYRGGTEAL